MRCLILTLPIPLLQKIQFCFFFYLTRGFKIQMSTSLETHFVASFLFSHYLSRCGY